MRPRRNTLMKDRIFIREWLFTQAKRSSSYCTRLISVWDTHEKFSFRYQKRQKNAFSQDFIERKKCSHLQEQKGLWSVGKETKIILYIFLNSQIGNHLCSFVFCYQARPSNSFSSFYTPLLQTFHEEENKMTVFLFLHFPKKSKKPWKNYHLATGQR